MEPTEVVLAASRLCSACGLCCNGVMFHTVKMQAGDSPKELAALGLKLKRKSSGQYLLQPCPAFCGTHCSIYDSRPERCRMFECQQLKRVAAGETTETAALECIREAQRRVGELEELLEKAGKTDPKRALSKRYEKVTAEPVTALSDPEAVALRERLTGAMRELELMLDREFRVSAEKVKSGQ
ncbi:MAG: YkgJ family cysteine cluster protein [Chthoniobacteraceae bacterium]